MPSSDLPAPDLPPAVTRRNAALVWHYLRPQRAGIALSAPAAILLGVASAAMGALVGPAMQILSAPHDQVLTFAALLGKVQGGWLEAAVGVPGIAAGDLMARLPAALVAVAFVRAALALGLWFFWEQTSERAAMRLRDDLVSSYALLDPACRREEDARVKEAELSSGVTTDVKLMREYIVHFYGGLPRDALQVLFLAAQLVVLTPKLTALFLLGILPAVAGAGRIGRKLRRRAAAALADYSQLTEWLQQRLLGIETIKHYRTEDVESAKMRELTTNLYGRFVKAARVKARTSPVIEALAVASMAGVLVIALRDISAGASSGAVLMSFFFTLALLSQAAGRLGRYLNSNREGAAAVDRLRQLLAFFVPRCRPRVAVSELHVAPQARLVCSHLTARYPGAAQPALADFSFTFEGGKIYCLAGPSGAGKSTLFNLLLGLVRPEQGDVRLEANARGAGAPVGYMPQKVLLMPESLAANVAYPDTAPDAARVAEALAKVGLTELAAGLPGGLYARVGEGGVGVSGGQAQRVLLARLWYHQKPFVLVDEGTSALDPEVERVIYALLRELCKRGAAVITIAHRMAAAEAADVLLLLDRGQLRASGQPKEVMASQAFAEALR